MTLNDYREQFKKNMMVMSRTAKGTLDLSASASKKDSIAAGSAEEAQSLALRNTDRAIAFLFDNRRRRFRSPKELEDLLLETAEITNEGIVKEGCLFRSGEDSSKFNYARTKDVPVIWAWFVHKLYWELRLQCIEAEHIAAFSEYIINIVGHFFSDGCGKISMLISTYVFMRYDLPCPEYTSRDEYYRVAKREKVPKIRDLRHLASDRELLNFIYYYLSLCRNRNTDFSSYLEKEEDGSYVYHLIGRLTEAKSPVFRQNIESLFEKNEDVTLVLDCRTLAWIDMECIGILADLKAAGKRFVLRNLNTDCMVLFRVEGFESLLEEDDKLPEIDLSGCEKISEGANGIIYRVTDEVVAKTFKNEPNYYDIARQRIAMKNALIAGVPAPISFGYAEYDGRIVTLMELIDSRSLFQVISSEKDCDEYILRYAQFVKQLHEIRDERILSNFMRNAFGEEILSKADRCDRFLGERYRGRARKIIEAADEPECLVHGDIQPKNIMISGDEMLFIDFDSFSTGKPVYDLGALYRTLLCNGKKDGASMNTFLGLSCAECRRIWDLFVREYYKDESEETIQKKVTVAKLIGAVLTLAKVIKKEEGPETISKWAAELEEIIKDCLISSRPIIDKAFAWRRDHSPGLRSEGGK